MVGINLENIRGKSYSEVLDLLAHELAHYRGFDDLTPEFEKEYRRIREKVKEGRSCDFERAGLEFLNLYNEKSFRIFHSEDFERFYSVCRSDSR